jgi:phosphatidylserine/phosphatidylglycerophosphate/cardiolipin synthase-like enzyme
MGASSSPAGASSPTPAELLAAHPLHFGPRARQRKNGVRRRFSFVGWPGSRCDRGVHFPRHVFPAARLFRLRFVLLLALAAPALAVPDPEVYFSQSDPVQQVIVRRIESARRSIHLLIYSITDDRLAAALVAASKRGVDVKIVCDKSQSAEKHSLASSLLEQLGPERVRLSTGKGRGIMHEKMAIYDGAEVTLGSFNWTDNARENNWENLIVLHDPKLAANCEREFQRVWSRPAKPASPPAGKRRTKTK